MWFSTPSNHLHPKEARLIKAVFLDLLIMILQYLNVQNLKHLKLELKLIRTVKERSCTNNQKNIYFRQNILVTSLACQDVWTKAGNTWWSSLLDGPSATSNKVLAQKDKRNPVISHPAHKKSNNNNNNNNNHNNSNNKGEVSFWKDTPIIFTIQPFASWGVFLRKFICPRNILYLFIFQIKKHIPSSIHPSIPNACCHFCLVIPISPTLSSSFFPIKFPLEPKRLPWWMRTTSRTNAKPKPMPSECPCAGQDQEVAYSLKEKGGKTHQLQWVLLDESFSLNHDVRCFFP